MPTTSKTAAPVELSAEEKRVVHKAAWRIIPFAMFCLLLAFIDRTNIGFASLQMNEALNISPSVFGLAGGVFFVAYFLCEVPSNLAMDRFGARLWLARIMVVWGVVATATAFVPGARSFLALRFLLGAAEAGFFPASFCSSPAGSRVPTEPSSSVGSRWPSRSLASSARRFPQHCSRYHIGPGWQAGNGCSSSKVYPQFFVASPVFL